MHFFGTEHTLRRAALQHLLSCRTPFCEGSEPRLVRVLALVRVLTKQMFLNDALHVTPACSLNVHSAVSQCAWN
jgi:hypothetical protein